MIIWFFFFLFSFLAALFALSALGGWWRGLRLRLVFGRAGSEDAGLVAISWLWERRFGFGARRIRLWLPRPVSRRLWLARACGSGWFARWLRRRQ